MPGRASTSRAVPRTGREQVGDPNTAGRTTTTNPTVPAPAAALALETSDTNGTDDGIPA